jgi:hypothetical protein
MIVLPPAKNEQITDLIEDFSKPHQGAFFAPQKTGFSVASETNVSATPSIPCTRTGKLSRNAVVRPVHPKGEHNLRHRHENRRFPRILH